MFNRLHTGFHKQGADYSVFFGIKGAFVPTFTVQESASGQQNQVILCLNKVWGIVLSSSALIQHLYLYE